MSETDTPDPEAALREFHEDNKLELAIKPLQDPQVKTAEHVCNPSIFHGSKQNELCG
jgi:hypothetical protein